MQHSRFASTAMPSMRLLEIYGRNPERRLGRVASRRYRPPMTLTLPDIPATAGRTEAELRLELACALYGQGKVNRVAGAELAGVDFFSFQGALGERGIPIYSGTMLEEDMAALQKLFPA